MNVIKMLEEQGVILSIITTSVLQQYLASIHIQLYTQLSSMGGLGIIGATSPSLKFPTDLWN